MKDTTSSKSQQHQWLSLSVFCEIEHWKPLQELCIDLMYHKLNGSDYLTAIHLANRAQLDFFIQVPFQYKRESARQLDQALQKFLSQLPDAALQSEENIFMPFPQNSVQYGIMKPPARPHLKLQNILSRINTAAIGSEISQDDVLINLYLIYGIMMHEFHCIYPGFQNIYIEKLMKQAAVDDISAYADLYNAENEIFSTLGQAILQSEIFEEFPILISVSKYIRSTLRPFESNKATVANLFKLADELFKIISIYVDVDWFMKWSVLYAIKKLQTIAVS